MDNSLLLAFRALAPVDVLKELGLDAQRPLQLVVTIPYAGTPTAVPPISSEVTGRIASDLRPFMLPGSTVTIAVGADDCVVRATRTNEYLQERIEISAGMCKMAFSMLMNHFFEASWVTKQLIEYLVTASLEGHCKLNPEDGEALRDAAVFRSVCSCCVEAARSGGKHRTMMIRLGLQPGSLGNHWVRGQIIHALPHGIKHDDPWYQLFVRLYSGVMNQALSELRVNGTVDQIIAQPDAQMPYIAP